MLADCKVKEEAVAYHSLILANRREITTLTVADLVANQVDIENLVDTNRELTEIVHTFQKYAFNYFEKLLLPALAVKWQLIVKEEVGGVDYVPLTGTKPGLIKTWLIVPLLLPLCQECCTYRFS